MGYTNRFDGFGVFMNTLLENPQAKDPLVVENSLMGVMNDG